MKARTHRVCLRSRRIRQHCTGGPPCQNCVRLGKETCEFVFTATSRKRVTRHKRNERDACGACRMKNTLCKGGPPCQECFQRKETCAFPIDSGSRKQPWKRCKSACQRCHSKKIRCTGAGPPCGTCTARGLESTCEFPKADIHTDNTASLEHCDVGKEPPRNYGLETHPIQRPESPVREGNDSGPLFCTHPFAAPDKRGACLNQSLEVTARSFQASNLTALSKPGEAPSLNVSSSDHAVDASSPGDRPSYEQLLDVLPGRELTDHLIKRYFTSISTVGLTHQIRRDKSTDKNLAILYHRCRHLRS